MPIFNIFDDKHLCTASEGTYSFAIILVPRVLTFMEYLLLLQHNGQAAYSKYEVFKDATDAQPNGQVVDMNAKGKQLGSWV